MTYWEIVLAGGWIFFNLEHGVCNWDSFLSDDQQSHVRNDVEDQKDDFEQTNERLNDHIGKLSPFFQGCLKSGIAAVVWGNFPGLCWLSKPSLRS